MTPEPLVFVIDDDQAVRQFLCKLIASVGLEVEPYAMAQTFLDAGKFERPGCLVLDIRMREMSGLELQQELARRQVDLPIIMLTGHGNVQVAVHAMKAGAIDFIEKPFNNELLLDRIQHAVAESILRYDDHIKRKELSRRRDSLTARERQVLDLVVAGMTNKVMADRLNISEKTVENHRARMMEKMSASSLPDLINMVAQIDIR